MTEIEKLRTELDELKAVVKVQSQLIADILLYSDEEHGPLLLTNDHGHELIVMALEDLPQAPRKEYFRAVEAAYPRHSTEQR